MGIPSENKNQINRTREEPDPSAFSVKPELDEEKGAGLRGKDKKQGEPNNGIINPGRNAETLKPIAELDQTKAGLQDDHDARDIGQQQNDKGQGDFEPPKQPAGPYDSDDSGGKVDRQGLPDDTPASSTAHASIP